MKLLYKDLTIAYICSVILIVFLYIETVDYIAYFCGYNATIIVLSILMIAVILLNRIINKIAMKRYLKITSIFSDKCIITEMVEKNNLFLTKKIPPLHRKTIILNTAFAYVFSDKPEKALILLEEIENTKPNRYTYKLIFDKYFINFIYYYRIGNIELMNKNYKEMKKIVEIGNCVPKLKILIAKPFAVSTVLIKYVNADFTDVKIEDCEKDFEDLFKIVKTNFYKIFIKYSLAMCYEKVNDFEKTKQAYEFVKENGGETFMKTNAEVWLNNKSNNNV